MPIYINQNGQQSGPYEDHVVIDQLRSGMLSPNDMAIRHGEASWQSLGEMFPGVAARAAEPAVGANAAAYASAGTASAVPAPKKGGCLKAGLLGTGLVLLLLGIAVAAGSRFIPSVSCDLAESDAQKISKLRADIERAKSDFKYERVGPLQMELEQTLSGAEVSQRYCDNDKFRDDMIGIAGGVVAAIGFLMAVVGLFVGRRK
jgi:hypothetical protein